MHNSLGETSNIEYILCYLPSAPLGKNIVEGKTPKLLFSFIDGSLRNTLEWVLSAN